MNYNHIMVDLETLDSRPTALILSIGAVRFSLDSLALSRDEFYHTVDPASCEAVGLTVSVDTVRWWMEQNLSARSAAFAVKPGDTNYQINRVLLNFARFVEDVPDTMIWGNGATFDNMILRNAYVACGLRYPVSYRNDLCYRTMRRMFPVEKVGSGTEHNALDDARAQALTLIEIMRKLRAPQVVAVATPPFVLSENE